MNKAQEAITIRNLTKRFGQETVLKDVSLSLEEGKIHGMIGRNGSGKTVLMKCICGFLRPSEGTVSVFGRQIGRDCDFAPETGMLIETPAFLPHETGLSNLIWLDNLSKQPMGKAVVSGLIAQVGLDPSLKRGVGKYSLGMRQRLGIAQALLGNPRLLILDEPMNGLDKAGVKDIRAMLLRLKEEGKTILLASHFKQDIDELCDTVSEMDQGRLSEIN